MLEIVDNTDAEPMEFLNQCSMVAVDQMAMKRVNDSDTWFCPFIGLHMQWSSAELANMIADPRAELVAGYPKDAVKEKLVVFKNMELCQEFAEIVRRMGRF